MDVKIQNVKKFSDRRGDLVVFLQDRELTSKNKKFGQIYFVTFEEKGVIRGNHYHNTFREWFGVVSGKLHVYLKDVDTGEEKEFMMNSKDKEFMRLEIGPRVAHSFESITKFAALLNYTNILWNPDDVFEEKLLTHAKK